MDDNLESRVATSQIALRPNSDLHKMFMADASTLEVLVKALLSEGVSAGRVNYATPCIVRGG